MSNLLSIGRRVQAGLLCCVLLLLCVSTAVGEPKPLSKEEQAKVDAAIDKGVAFLKKAQTRDGDFGWKMFEDGRYLVGQCALPAYALLESEVPADDPVIQKAATFLRPLVVLTDSTYELSLAILFFDRLGDPKDKNLIRMCALRLIAGQHRAGGWSYRCPIMNDKNAQDLLRTLGALNKRRKDRSTRGQALEGLEVPAALQELTVFQSATQLPWREPAETPDSVGEQLNRLVLDGRSDNSNTQFALLGLWAALRHGVAVEPALELSVERFERFHLYPSGIWMYSFDSEVSASSRKSMTCVGLIALAIGRGLKLPTPGSPAALEKDVHILRGLAALSKRIGKPIGDTKKRLIMQDLYFLWSLERVGMLYDLPTIGDKDWYRWGAEILVTNQFNAGWWPMPPIEKRWSTKASCDLKLTLSASFGLLFLKRSHPMKDLTPKLPFTAKELNEGIVRLRPRDTFPMRNVTAPSPSKNPER